MSMLGVIVLKGDGQLLQRPYGSRLGQSLCIMEYYSLITLSSLSLPSSTPTDIGAVDHGCHTLNSQTIPSYDILLLDQSHSTSLSVVPNCSARLSRYE